MDCQGSDGEMRNSTFVFDIKSKGVREGISSTQVVLRIISRSHTLCPAKCTPRVVWQFVADTHGSAGARRKRH